MKIGNTDDGMAEIRNEEAKAHQRLATANAQRAVDTAEHTRDELLTRVDVLTANVSRLEHAVANLDRKYNLLLSERFNTGPTVTE